MPQELNYSSIHGQESMLKDRVRCEAFQKALAETVTPGAVVLDVGAGTGLLSMFAAQAGAGRVYAVERTEVAQFASHLVTENGFGDRIEVIQNDIDAVTLPEPVDIIVSEWLDGYALDENLLPIVIRARDRWLKPGGRMIPGSVTSFLAPAYDTQHQQDCDFWNSYPYGLELGSIAAVRGRHAYASRYDLNQDRIPCAAQAMWDVDCRTCTLDEASRAFEARLAFTSGKTAPVNALAAWFDATLSSSVNLRNGPTDPETHWGRCVFPIGKVMDMAPGMEMQATFAHRPAGKGHSTASWQVEIDGYTFSSSDDTTLIT